MDRVGSVGPTGGRVRRVGAPGGTATRLDDVDRGGVRRDRLLAAASRQPAVAVAASALFGAVYIAVTGVLLVWSTRVYPTQPATGVGLAFLLVAVGQAAAAPVLGFVADRAGLTTSFWMSAGVALAAVAVTPPARFRRT